MDNRFNEVFPSFDTFNREFIPGQCLIDIFTNHFSFYTLRNCSNNNFKTHLQSLNNVALASLLNPSIALVISDTSIKN